MRFDQFIQSFGMELQELFWQDFPGRTLEKQIEHLEEAIEELTVMSVQQKTRIDRLKKKIADDEQQSAWLTQRVEVYLNINDRPNAWQHALQLDQMRQTSAADRSELQRRQRAYSDQVLQIRRLHQRRARLRDKFVGLQ